MNQKIKLLVLPVCSIFFMGISQASTYSYAPGTYIHNISCNSVNNCSGLPVGWNLVTATLFDNMRHTYFFDGAFWNWNNIPSIIADYYYIDANNTAWHLQLSSPYTVSNPTSTPGHWMTSYPNYVLDCWSGFKSPVIPRPYDVHHCPFSPIS